MYMIFCITAISDCQFPILNNNMCFGIFLYVLQLLCFSRACHESFQIYKLFKQCTERILEFCTHERGTGVRPLHNACWNIALFWVNLSVETLVTLQPSSKTFSKKQQGDNLFFDQYELMSQHRWFTFFFFYECSGSDTRTPLVRAKL
jgi:hypothetical protein